MRSFLESCGVRGVELSDESGRARVYLVPEWQGRVITSTATGTGGPGYGWINRSLIASGVRKSRFNPFGGEERLWLGPEGGPFSLYFAPGAEQVYANWQVPAALDTEPFRVVGRDARQVRFEAEMSLRNAAGTRFEIGVTRRVELLSLRQAEASLGCALPPELAVVAYRSENRISNCGTDAWTSAGGAPSLWMLGMFTPSPSTTVFLPCDGEDARAAVNSDYFGTLPDDRLSVSGRLVCLRIDGEFRSKIGLPAGHDTGLCGSYDAAAYHVTLVRYRRSAAGDRYVDSRWGAQANPFGGDVVNAYNDGPTETGEVMGPFFEIETSSPAAFLRPGETLCHAQEIFHLQGDEALLEELLRDLIPGGLRAVKEAFNH
ncbi:DUF6786 family protein [Alistipes finegoldii]|uniref:DUF6786 family protein n=2 Tax=Alistipes finegoldii TaxID=214856 RepID=UPI003AF1240F